MIFPDQGSAKSLFIRKVLEQAEYEGVAISAAQQYMLAWSESDPSFKQDSKLNSQFEQEIAQGEYEKKIQGLLKRAYKRDIQRDSSEKSTYREAYRVLSQGDHYILVMIQEALGV